MANTVIALKKSAIPSAAPVSLANGELAINYADGKLFYKHANGTIAAISSGAGGDSFGTVNAAGTLIIADTAGDILTLEAGSGITITGDAINDKITISSTGGDISPAFIQANTARDQANAAFDKANSANVLAFNTGLGANAFTSATIAGANTAVGAGANSYANLVWSRSNTYADTVGVSANAYANLVWSRSNTYADTVGTSANAFTSATIAGANTAVGTGANAFTSATIAGANTAVGAGANAYAAIVGSSANTFTSATIAGANTAVGAGANAFTSATIAGANTAVGAGANAYASIVGTSANTVGIAAFLQANVARTHANAAFGVANTALPNTSGVSFVGNLNFPSGNVGIGTTSPASPTKLDVRGVIQGQSYALPNDLGVAQWVKLGTLTIPQGGYTARIRMYMHQGYNAVNTQDFYTDIFFKTSNASSVDGNGFSGNSWYYSHGFNLANITPKWVGNAAGVSASAYDLYINVPSYIQNSHYIVEIVEGVNWTHLGTLSQVDPGSGSSTVCISSVGYNITLGNVGIGRTNPGYKLDIVGTANVSNMLVNGNMVFTTANDGTGSNLDADLLDGQHGSFYSTDTKATAAFDKANTAGTDAVNAFTQANTARNHANAAFLSSNSVNTFSSATFVRLTAASQTITGNVNIVGDLTLSGNTFTIDATRLEVDDPLIYLAANNYSSDIVDIGFIGNYVNATGANVHTGLYREHTDKMYYLFQGYDVEPINNHIGALSNNMTLAVLNADIRTSNLVLGGANAILTIAGVGTAANNFASATIAGANTAVGTAANNFASATIAGANTAVGTAANNFAIATIAGANTAVGAGANSVGIAAFTQANTARNHANAAFATANAALPSSSYTASDVLSKLLTVDGAASGLDADLLDGQHGSFYSTDTKATAAFGQANTALTTGQAAFAAANSRVSSVSGTSGRITSSGGTTPAIDLATAGAGAATYSSGISALTVDAYGRITSVTGSAGYVTSSGVTSVSGTGTVSGLTLTGTVTTTGNLTLGGQINPQFSGDSVAKDDITTRTDSGIYETSTGTVAEGWPTNAGSWHHLIAATHSNDTNYYSMQISATFFDQDWYFRNTNGSGTTGWSKVWHNNNDGAASGLDADLLDGQHGSFYSTDTKATAAFGQANTALTTGQAAFAQANSRVSSVSGTGTVSGISLSGTVTSSGSLTLGGTLSASVIDNMTDEHRLFNNMGDNHATRTAFDATNPSYNFGWRFVQGSTNGPGVNGAGQYYSEYVGLGNDYLATGAGSYGMQIAYPRNVTEPYIAIRYNENNTLGAWQKISAGNSDKLNGQASTFYSTDAKATAAFDKANTALTTGKAITMAMIFG